MHLTLAAMQVRPFRANCGAWKRSRRRAFLCIRASAAAEAEEKRIREMAKHVADKYIQPNSTVGIGTGAAVNYLLEELAHRIDAGTLQGVRCVPASAVSASEAAFHGVPLATPEEVEGVVDLFLEVADELDGSDPSLGFIAGRASKPQQPQLVRMRQLAGAARSCVVLLQSSDQLVSRLGGDVPVAVDEEVWEDAAEELDDIFVGDADIWRRSTTEGAGPRGGDHPYVSPAGHNLLDIRFYEGLKLFGEEASYEEIAREIEGVEGVAAHGLYVGVASAAVVAGEGGPMELQLGAPLNVGSEE